MKDKKREILYQVDYLLRKGVCKEGAVLDTFAILADEYKNTKIKRREIMTKEAEKKAFGGGVSNFEKYGEVVSKKLKVREIIDEYEGATKFFILKDGELRVMADKSESDGVAAFVYRVPPKKEEKKKEKKPAYTIKEIKKMDRDDLEELVDDLELKIKVKKIKDDDDLRDEIIEALGLEDEKPAKKGKKEDEDENEDEDNALSWNDFLEKDRDELIQIIEDNDLDIDPDDYEKKTKKMRKAIWIALGGDKSEFDE